MFWSWRARALPRAAALLFIRRWPLVFGPRSNRDLNLFQWLGRGFLAVGHQLTGFDVLNLCHSC